MESQSKIKMPAKHRGGNVVETPLMGNGGDSLRQSMVTGSQGLNTTGFVNISSANAFPSIEDTVKLYGKDDIFNHELSPHQIETELLCSERLLFQFEFTTEKPDITLKIIKNSNIETKLQQTQIAFTTGYYK